jgi:hypothetical protein
MSFITTMTYDFAGVVGPKKATQGEQVPKAMQAAGRIDLSSLAEDGTKLRANGSRRSFHSAAEIATIIDKLKAELARKLEKVVSPEARKGPLIKCRGMEAAEARQAAA